MLLALVLASLPPLSLPAQQFQLPNGLTVIISPDRTVPGVALDLWYHVGSKDEEPGRTGFAHLFEHLMFMGAHYVPYPKFDTIMEAGGGTNNASTGNDTTHYYEGGPSNLLETFLWMESDRMATLGEEITADKLETQRKIVLNERRQSYENRPYGLAEIAVYENLFPQGHPYHWPTIGSTRDIEAAQLDDVKRFFARWYVPSNASLTIVGDVDPVEAERLVRRYFGWMPKATLPPHPSPPPVVLSSEHRVSLSDQVELPKIIIAWASPGVYQPGDAECDLLSLILAKSKASRFYEELVHKREIATEVQVMQENFDLQSVFRIEAVARPGHTTAELQAAIDDTLKSFLKEGPTVAEVEAARVGIYTNAARALEGLLPRAELLSTYQLHFGQSSAIAKDLGRYESVTPASVIAVGKQVLGKGRVVVEIQPAPAAAATAGGAP